MSKTPDQVIDDLLNDREKAETPEIDYLLTRLKNLSDAGQSMHAHVMEQQKKLQEMEKELYTQQIKAQTIQGVLEDLVKMELDKSAV